MVLKIGEKMKTSKGFTLVELIGVVAIIAAILIFTIPSVIGILKRDSDKEYSRFLTDLYLATETYVEGNIENYPNLSVAGGSETIMMQELIENGYVKSTIINPKTDQKINATDTIIITKKASGGYEYQYQTN